jgi:hypothetical protein
MIELRVHAMKKLQGSVLFLLVLAAGIALVATRSTDAQTSTPTASTLQIVSYASGLTGVFDPSTGRIYLYDANLEHCVAVREIVAPGESMKRLKN